METEEIIKLLRKPEYYYDGDGFPIEKGVGVFDHDKPVLELDHDQDKLYTAILKTIPKETLLDIAQELDKKRNSGDEVADILVQKIEWMSKEHPQKENIKNATITSLMNQYLDKKSKKVKHARDLLRDRFDKQSYLVQNRILREFLKGTKTDYEWAGRRLRDNWRPEMKALVGEVWKKTRNQILAYVILRHFPNSYIIQEQYELEKVVNYAYICARVGNDSSFNMDLSRFSVPELFYVLAKLNRLVDAEDMEKRLYDYLLNYDYNYSDLVFQPISFASIKGMDQIVWAMGVLGMQDALIRLLNFENRVKERSKTEDETGQEIPSWPLFVTAIKDEIDPSDYDNRLRDETLAYESRHKLVYYSLINDDIDIEQSDYVPQETSQEFIQIKTEDDLMKEWYYQEATSKNLYLTPEQEWGFYIDSFFYDRPNILSLLKDAVLIQKDPTTIVVVITVHNAEQEYRMNEGVIQEIQSHYKGRSLYKYCIDINKTDDYYDF